MKKEAIKDAVTVGAVTHTHTHTPYVYQITRQSGESYTLVNKIIDVNKQRDVSFVAF